MASPDAAVVVLDPLAAVVALAEAAYRMGAKDARHLCIKDVERIAGWYVATTVKPFVEAIRAIEPARAMPDFTSAALVALGAPTSDADVCAECGGTVEPERAGTGWPTCHG